MSHPRPVALPHEVRMALAVLFLAAAALSYLFGLFVGLFGFCPNSVCSHDVFGVDALILLAVVAGVFVTTIVFIRRSRVLWGIPLAGVAVIIAAWAASYAHAGFTAFGV